MTDAPNGRVILGVVVGTYGIGGAVRIKSFTQNPRDIARYGQLYIGAGDETLTLTRVVAHKAGVRAGVKGVGNRTQAEALIGAELSIDRVRLSSADLAAEEFYHADLIGLEAVAPDGAVLGRVTACYNFGAGDVLEIGDALYPFTRAVVPQIDIDGGCLTLIPPAETMAQK